MQKSILLPGISAVVIAATAMLFIASCKKNNSVTSDTAATNYATDQAVTEKSYDDAQTISESANASGPGSLNYRTAAATGLSCATVTRDTTGSMVTLTINFGATDCTCHDGRSRRGEIIVTYPSTGWFVVGNTRTITFSNYYQNDNQVTGTKTVTYEGLNTANEPYDNITINGSIIYASGKTVNAVWTRTRTWLSGFTLTGSTPVWTSDITYSVSGSGTLTSSAGQEVDVDIAAATPLVFAYGCQWIESGTITFTLTADGRTRTLNYGSTPVCDDQATLTLATGKTVNITLP